MTRRAVILLVTSLVAAVWSGSAAAGTATDEAGPLPITGFDLGLLAGVAGVMVVGGVALRRLARPRAERSTSVRR